MFSIVAPKKRCYNLAIIYVGSLDHRSGPTDHLKGVGYDITKDAT